MRILCPPGELVVDGSLWNHHLLPQELLAGGIRWVVIGLYKQWDPAIGKYVLNTNSKRLCDQAIAGGLGLMTYYYYHPQDNPVAEADWYIDMQTRSGYPVPFTWADCESFNYTMDPHVRSENNRLFCTQLRKRFPAMGLYTPKWYIDQWAPQMGTWVGDFSYAWVSHYGRQPKVATSMTWDILKNSWTPNYDIEVAPSQANKTVGHQFTGDVCILPGLYSELNARMTTDVSVFAKEFIASLGGSPMPAHPPHYCQVCGIQWNDIPAPAPAGTPYKVRAGSNPNVRSEASSLSALVPPLMMYPYSIQVDKPPANGYTHFLPDATYPNGGWVLTRCIEPA